MLNYLLAPTFQYINTAGRPLSGGAYLEVYIHGTRDKYYCASDFEGNLHPFQIPLDSLGANVVLAEDTGTYDVYAYNRYGSLIMSRYNVRPGAGGGSGMGTITSSDGSIEVTPTSTGVDLKVTGQEPSVLRATADDLDADGSYTFSALVIDGEDLSVDENGRIRMEDGWYHYDATVRLVWEDSVNDSATVQLYTTLNSDVMEFDLSYAHDETVQLGGEMKITTGGTSFVLGVSGLPNGMVAQLVDLGIHTITGHGDAAGYEAGDGIIIDDHEISIDPSVVQEKLTAGENIQISDENVISATDTTYTAGTGLDLEGTEFSVDTSEIQEKLTAGTNIQINGSTISATDTTYTAGTGLDLNGTEFSVDTSEIQEKLTAGSNIVIEGNTISATAEPQLQANWAETDTTSVQYIQNKPQNLVQDPDYVHTDNNYTDAEKSKLAGIEAGAEANVQSDWTETDSRSDAYIKHKPSTKPVAAGDNITITETASQFVISAAEQQQANWNESDTDSAQYIQNKPDLSVYATTQAMDTALAGKQDVISDLATIRSGASAGATAVQPADLAPYATTADMNTALAGKQDVLTAGNNITITNNVISADAAPQLQANWTESDNTSVQYIQNKPSEKSLVAGTHVTLTESGSVVYVNADWPTVDQTYDATSTNAQSGVAIASAIANNGLFEATYGTTTLSEVVNAISAHKIVYCRVSGRMAFLAYIGTSNVEFQYYRSNSQGTGDSMFVYTVSSSGWTTTERPAYVQSNWNTTSSSDAAYIRNKPSIPTKTSDLTNDSGYITASDIPAQVQSDWTEADTTSAAYIANKPNLATVATTGDYSDLLNTPTLAAVATSGDYTDLSNTPHIPVIGTVTL